MPQSGKIARLPACVREELNRRLECSVPGPELTRWLNSLPEVQEVLTASFHNRPVSEQNISNWRRHGFLQWQSRQEFHDRARDLAAGAAEIEPLASSMATHASRLLSIHFAQLLSPSFSSSCSSSRSKSPPSSTPSNQATQSSVLSPQSSKTQSSIRVLCAITRAITAIRRADLESARHQFLQPSPSLPAGNLSAVAPPPLPAPSRNQAISSYLKASIIPAYSAPTRNIIPRPVQTIRLSA